MGTFRIRLKTFLQRTAVAVAGLLPGFCQGSLVWETRLIERIAGLGEKEVVALFPFKNTGTTPVTIQDIVPSCDCTVAELAQRTFAPGESGALKVVFAIGDRMGPQEKQIMVTTDDATAGTSNLTLRVHTPDLLRYSSRMLRWPLNGKREEQSVEIDLLGKDAITAMEITGIAPDKQAVVRIEPIKPGAKYRLVITPTALDQPRTIVVTLLARFEGGASHSFRIFALVR